MKKGISPVVATVLLIAIAVVGAAGVWFYTSPFITQNSSAQTAGSYNVRLSTCRIQGNLVSIFVRNVGITNTKSTHNISAYFVDDDSSAGKVNLKSLVIGGTYWKNFTNTSPVASEKLYLEDDDYPTIYFEC